MPRLVSLFLVLVATVFCGSAMATEIPEGPYRDRIEGIVAALADPAPANIEATVRSALAALFTDLQSACATIQSSHAGLFQKQPPSLSLVTPLSNGAEMGFGG